MTDTDITEILSINLITRNPSIRNGRPVIHGTTLEVVDVVLAKIQNRLDSESLAAWFQIGAAETYAALAYYYLHKAEIDGLIHERERVTAEMLEVRSEKHSMESEAVPSDEEITQLLADLGKNPLTGREIVEAGLTGGWEDKGITDSVEWLAAQCRKRREKFG